MVNLTSKTVRISVFSKDQIENQKFDTEEFRKTNHRGYDYPINMETSFRSGETGRKYTVYFDRFRQRVPGLVRQGVEVSFKAHPLPQDETETHKWDSILNEAGVETLNKVSKIVLDYLNSHSDVDYLKFSGKGGGKKGLGRAAVYARLIQRVLPDWERVTEELSEEGDFTLARK